MSLEVALINSVLNTLLREHALPAVRLAALSGVPLGELLSVLSQLEKRGLIEWRDQDSRGRGVVVATREAGLALAQTDE